MHPGSKPDPMANLRRQHRERPYNNRTLLPVASQQLVRGPQPARGPNAIQCGCAATQERCRGAH